jgi:hypothetical protein
MVEIKYPERMILGSALGGLLGAMTKEEGATAIGTCIGTLIGLGVSTDVFERKMEDIRKWKDMKAYPAHHAVGR